MREIMNLVESGFLDHLRRSRAKELVQNWPTVEPGMFVQLSSWFGDVWSEITSTFQNGDDPVWYSVSFYRYEKYCVTRKLDSAYYGDIRKFARREEIDFKTSIVFTPTHCYRHGKVVEWPAGVKGRRDNGGYEMHPTLPPHR